MQTKDFAICFSGQTRQLYNGFNDFKILFDNQDYDVFAHIWDSNELLSGWGHNIGWEYKKTPIQSPQEFIQVYNPKKSEVENYSESFFHGKVKDNQGYGNPVNKVYSSLSQFYSLKKSFIVLQQYQKENDCEYKYAIRYRSDLELDKSNSSINWEEIKLHLDKNPKTILVNPGWDWPNGHGCANMFAIGTTKSMIEYSNLYDNYVSILKENPFSNYDESNLKFHLEKKCGLTISNLKINMGMYR